MIGFILSIVITIVLLLLVNYFALPALTFANPGFWLFAIVIALVAAGCFSCSAYINEHKPSEIAMKITLGASIGGCAILLIGLLIGSPMFNAGTHANLIKVTDGDISEIPTVDDLNKIPLMDTESAKKLGDRTVGSLTDIVSQYEVSDNYTTIYYNDRVYKIAPLEYAGLFKYNSNKYNGIPGYVLVDTENNSAEYIELEKGFRISDSAFFGNDLMRTARNQYSSLLFGDYNFQIDEEGKPYWIIAVKTPQTAFGAYVITGTIVMDATTGVSEYYTLDDTPEWVDYIITGDKVSTYYNKHGDYNSGFWNSILSQKGVTHTTDDFGYIAKDNDIWVYTGITSVNNDESNLGFIMVNSRTGECKYMLCDGAEEYSAMSAAEGAVQNYGYTASFPALINVNDEPTYALVLKDANGLIKQYAFVNVKNYTIVTTATTMNKAYNNYLRALNGEDISGDTETTIPEQTESTGANNPEPRPEIDFSSGEHIAIVVSDIMYHVIDGDTYAYVIDDTNAAYKINVGDNEEIIFTKPGDELSLISMPADNNIHNATLE